MNRSELTEKQLAALDSAHNIAVTAGAGTGKTSILVERYLDILINQNADIRQVLAITFTKKAAAEMTSRVAKQIEDLLTDLPAGKHRNRLVKIRDYLSAAYISTIHSFCARVLREYPVEAGMDPDFVQLSDMQFEILFKETLGEIVNELDREPSLWLELFRSVRMPVIENMLREALAHRFEMRRVVERYQGASPESLYRDLIEDYLEEAHQAVDRPQIDRILRQADSTFDNLINNDPGRPAVRTLTVFRQAGEPERIEFWQALADLREVYTTKEKKAYKHVGFLGGKEFWGPQNEENALALSRLLAGIGDFPEPVPGPADLNLLQLISKFNELYLRFEERFRQKKQAYNALDYEDLQLYVYDLMSSNPAVRRDIAGRFRYIMVDEFQDTNPLQWAIIAQLGELTDKKFFVVGDPKQSIYGFRNADVRVFQHVREAFIGNRTEEILGNDIVLEDSFRFKRNLAGFINRLFSEVMRPGTDRGWEVGYDPMTCRRKDADGGDIEIAVFKEDLQPDYIAASIHDLRARFAIEFGDMAVLLRNRNHLTEIEESFRRTGIPFKTIGGIGFFQRQEIYDVYHLIRFLISPQDDAAVVGLLRSPFADISDAGIFMLSRITGPAGYWEKLDRISGEMDIPPDDLKNMQHFRKQAGDWLQLRDRMSFNELLDNIFNQSGFRAIYAADHKAARYLANLDKILEQAVELERGGFNSLADFGDALQNLIRSQIQESEAPVELEDRTTVKIMTIHQAKGLEFPVVFVPYLEQRLRSVGFKQAVFDELYGFAPSVAGQEKSGRLQQIVRGREQEKALAELKRLFYVACTRAKDRLFLSGALDKGKIAAGTPLGWLAENFDLDPADSGPISMEEGILIRYELPVLPDVEKPVSGRTLKNIAELKKLLRNGERSDKPPYCFLPLEDQPEGEVFSATQLMMYDPDDPEEYFMRYHLGFFESDYDFGLKFDTEVDAALLRGKLIHKYFEEYPAFDLDRTLHEFEITDPILTETLKQDLFETVQRVSGSEQLSEILKAAEFANEVPAMRQIGPDLITGTIDRMYRNRDGRWEIIDYKTNRISRKQVGVTALKYQLQLQVYALLLEGMHPGQEYYQVNLYFTHIDVLYPAVFTAADLQKCAARIGQVIEGIKNWDPYRRGAYPG